MSNPTSEPQGDDTYLNSRQLRDRYGDVSEIWIQRREKDDPNWPKPLRIAGRKFYRLRDILEYERKLIMSA